jgi:uncharacterized membrane protein
MGQSPLSYALRDGGEGAPAVVQLRASVLPISTAWMAVSDLGPQPVSFYAVVFFAVNATYLALIWELVGRSGAPSLAPRARRAMLGRSLATLSLFALAAVAALIYPLVGLGICICCLALYIRPEAPPIDGPAPTDKAGGGA